MNLAEVGEAGAIARMARILGSGSLAPSWIGIGDDGSVTELGGGQALTTVDMLVEGVHFRLDTTTPENLGWKALAVNVSDIFAMGGAPSWAVVAIALRGDLPVSWLEALYGGLLEASRRYACPVVGGDTVGTPGPLAISITVVGHATRPRLRSAARPGDVLAVTGPLGLSAAGLWALGHPDAPLPAAAREKAVRAHVRPEPAGYPAALEGIDRLALMDDSDGLGASARQIAAASGAAVLIEADRLALEDEVEGIAEAAGVDPLEWRLWGGEDYGLVATFAGCDALPQGFRAVGRVEEGAGAHLLAGGQRIPLQREGYRHF